MTNTPQEPPSKYPPATPIDVLEMTEAVVNWMRQPEHANGFFDDNITKYSYPLLAEMIENGDEIGQEFMTGFLETQYKNLCRFEAPQEFLTSKDQEKAYRFDESHIYTHSEMGKIIRNKEYFGIKYSLDYYKVVSSLKARSKQPEGPIA